MIGSSHHHQLKVWPEPFAALEAGIKLFEFRKADRDYRVDDELVLDEWDPDEECYTGHTLRRMITYVLPGPAFGIPAGSVCLSLSPCLDTDRLADQAREISMLLTEAGCPSMSIVEGVRWLIDKGNSRRRPDASRM